MRRTDVHVARRRRGFTLIELLVALVASLVLILAGMTLLTTLISGATDVMARAVRQTEPQEIIDVLDPMMRRAGEALPVDSTFGGLTVSASGDTVLIIQAMPDAAGATRPTAEGTGCGTTLLDVTPTAGCALVQDVSAHWSGTTVLDDSYLLVITPARRVALSRVTAVTAIGNGYLRVQWAVTSTLGYPANTMAPGQPDVSLQRVQVSRLIYDAGAQRLLVDDPVARAAGGAPWELASGITDFVARPMYRGQASTAAVGALRPATAGNRTYVDVSGVQLTYTQVSTILRTAVSERRSVVLSPAGLTQ